ncbi:Aste57867_11825 [Aphanomyces stellatus]|uniref:Aste57867_11825 protein n=1 Tax=Aphanomyces stellatus TaxID=120398 RepID=A0A485KUL3_9STRA|nr:hypothetical protein As57867_011780 [Aphanomyces stellatus]VFT88680.1 Aste57867_11825 [Aphanomyces stellatus]
MVSLNAASLLSANQTAFKQCRTHGSFIKNFSGYMKIQAGFFGMWKMGFFTLQGIELAYAEDEGLPVLRSDIIAYVVPVKGKQTQLEFHMKSKKVWKTDCASEDIAGAWFAAVDDCMARLTYGIDRYLRSCEKKQTQSIMCGWLSHMDGKRVISRYFYILRHLTLSIAPNVDVLPEHYDVVTGLTAADLDGAMQLRFESQPMMVLRCDSVELLRLWHLIVRTCMNEPTRATFNVAPVAAPV